MDETSKPGDPIGVIDAGEHGRLGDVKAGDPTRSHRDVGMR
jgi:hypothetical protein